MLLPLRLLVKMKVAKDFMELYRQRTAETQLNSRVKKRLNSNMMTVVGRIQHQGNIKPQQRTKMPNTSSLKLSLGRAHADKSLQNSSSSFQRDKELKYFRNSPSQVPHAPVLYYEVTISKMR